jgi:hypothetical protein
MKEEQDDIADLRMLIVWSWQKNSGARIVADLRFA